MREDYKAAKKLAEDAETVQRGCLFFPLLLGLSGEGPF